MRLTHSAPFHWDELFPTKEPFPAQEARLMQFLHDLPEIPLYAVGKSPDAAKIHLQTGFLLGRSKADGTYYGITMKPNELIRKLWVYAEAMKKLKNPLVEVGETGANMRQLIKRVHHGVDADFITSFQDAVELDSFACFSSGGDPQIEGGEAEKQYKALRYGTLHTVHTTTHYRTAHLDFQFNLFDEKLKALRR